MNLDISRTDDAVRDALKKLSLLWKSRAAVNQDLPDRKSTRLNPSHLVISYPVFCLKKNSVPRPSRRGPARRDTPPPPLSPARADGAGPPRWRASGGNSSTHPLAPALTRGALLHPIP